MRLQPESKNKIASGLAVIIALTENRTENKIQLTNATNSRRQTVKIRKQKKKQRTKRIKAYFQARKICQNCPFIFVAMKKWTTI